MPSSSAARTETPHLQTTNLSTCWIDISTSDCAQVVHAGGLPNMQFAIQFSDWPQMEVTTHAARCRPTKLLADAV